jgi:hypothetical protein
LLQGGQFPTSSPASTVAPSSPPTLMTPQPMPAGSVKQKSRSCLLAVIHPQSCLINELANDNPPAERRQGDNLRKARPYAHRRTVSNGAPRFPTMRRVGFVRTVSCPPRVDSRRASPCLSRKKRTTARAKEAWSDKKSTHFLCEKPLRRKSAGFSRLRCK